MSPSATTPSDFVPSIDIRPYLSNPTSSKSQEILSTLRTALKRSGFFQITHHNIPRALQESVFAASKRYFALPVSEKCKLPLEESVGVRGYDAIATQTYGDDSTGDLKESFFIGCDLPLSDPNVVKRRVFSGPNIWPGALSEDEFRRPLEQHYDAVTALTLKVLEMVVQSLPHGLNAEAEVEKYTKFPIAAPMRLLHYPPQPGAKENQIGASSHTDFGTLTLLMQDGNKGLQILNKEAGPRESEWFDVEPLAGAYVVNAGDILERWTGGEYKSAQHRVINASPTKDRYSVAFFLEGNLDYEVKTLGAGEEDGESFTVEEHMIDRLSSSYSRLEGQKGYGET